MAQMVWFHQDMKSPRFAEIRLSAHFSGARPASKICHEFRQKDDQKRVMTPAEAWNLGGNILVVGRPITQAQNPERAAKQIAETIGVGG